MYNNIRLCISAGCMVLLAACAAKKPVTTLIRYDGVYRSPNGIPTEMGDTTYHYLRFYPDGKVQSLSTPSGLQDISVRFNLQNHSIAQVVGKLTITGNNISFTTNNGLAKVEYNGTVSDTIHLQLHIKNLITGNEHEDKYAFIQLKEWE